MELSDEDMEMSKHVGVWIIYRATVVIYIFVILNVHLLVKIKIIAQAVPRPASLSYRVKENTKLPRGKVALNLTYSMVQSPS